MHLFVFRIVAEELGGLPDGNFQLADLSERSGKHVYTDVTCASFLSSCSEDDEGRAYAL